MRAIHIRLVEQITEYERIFGNIPSPEEVGIGGIPSPKINDDVPIKKEADSKNILCRPGMIAIGVPWFVSCCCWSRKYHCRYT